MTIRPKLGIMKKTYLTDKGHYRYYSAVYDRLRQKLPKSQRPKMPIWDLNYLPQIQTEKQFIRLVYENFGPGEYLIFGFVKKRKGTWVFWQGTINEEGFVFNKKEYKSKKNYEKLKDELMKAEDEEERQWIHDEIDLCKEDEKLKDYGMKSYLKPSVRRGQMMYWNDEDDALINKEKQFDNWNSESKEEQFDDWGEANKKEEFEEW